MEGPDGSSLLQILVKVKSVVVSRKAMRIMQFPCSLIHIAVFVKDRHNICVLPLCSAHFLGFTKQSSSFSDRFQDCSLHIHF